MVVSSTCVTVVFVDALPLIVVTVVVVQPTSRVVVHSGKVIVVVVLKWKGGNTSVHGGKHETMLGAGSVQI